MTWTSVQKALLKFPASTAVGADGWSPRQLAHLPAEAGATLVLQLTALKRTMVLPEVQEEAWAVLLDKPDGGDRPIALLPFLYRLLLRCRKRQLDAWNTELDAWDATAKGKGAEQAANK